MCHSLIGSQCRFKEPHAQIPAEERVTPLYIYEGRGSNSKHGRMRRDGGDGRSPSSPQATLSRYSLSPLVEVIGLEEFGFKS